MRLLDTVNRSAREVDAKSSTESYFGERARILASKGTTLYALCEVQNFSIELYESRIVSMQRFVAMTVMFHEMGRRVQRFFHRLSFGYLGYRMDRTHSNIRIASTASPVSGSDVRAISVAIPPWGHSWKTLETRMIRRNTSDLVQARPYKSMQLRNV